MEDVQFSDSIRQKRMERTVMICTKTISEAARSTFVFLFKIFNTFFESCTTFLKLAGQ